MKYSLTLLLLSFLLVNDLTAQNPGNVSGNILWLKAANSEDSLTAKKVKEPSEINHTHFNFNPVTDSKSVKKSFRNIVNQQYSLFVVFKSDFEEEHNLLTLNRGKTKVLVTNKEVLNDKEMPYKVDSKQGIILSYINGNNDKNGKKRNSLVIDELFAEDKEGKEQLMELIYFPRLLTKSERQKLETWLSIKYGISISGEFDYLDSKGDKIWDVKESKTYNNRVTGIGRDDAYGLYQKQSGNSQKDGIYIGLGKIDTTNTLNKFIIEDQSFLLWGDNAGKTILSEDKNNKIKRMERIWKMDVSGINAKDSITTQLKLNKKEIAYTNKTQGAEFLWLCVNAIENSKFNYTDAKYYKQSSEDENFIYFNDISWDSDASGADVFTFIQGQDFFLEHTNEFACVSDSGLVSVKLIGGTPPYTLAFDGKEFTITNDYIEFSNLQSGKYSLKASESKGNSKTVEITLDPFSTVIISLNPVWYIGTSGEAIVVPVMEQTDAGLSFEWIKGDKILSTDKEFTSKIPGDYILRVITTEGCNKEIPFTIEDSFHNLSSGWIVYPNPAKSGEPFSIEFSFEKESEVILSINSMEGKQIRHKDLGMIKNFVYRDAIATAGVYLITLHIGNTAGTVKLIVH